MRSKYIPVVYVDSLVALGQKEYVPDWLNSVYVTAIKNLPTSKQLILPAKYVPYPELLSNDLYGTVDYWWVLCMFNGVVRIFTDMNAGDLWNIPALSDIQAMLSAGSSAGTNLIGSNVIV